MIIITSKTNGFRRCGIAHASTPTEYPDDRFTAADLAVMQADPRLIVEIVPAPAASEGIGNMTVAQLMEAISFFQPVDMLKGVRKAELVEILKAHQEVGPKE